MAKSKQNIGATLSLKDGGFFANIKSAQSESDNLKDSLGDATGETSGFSSGLQSIGGGVATAAKGIATVTAAVVGVTAAISGMALAIGQDYTSASNSFAAQTGITGDQLNDLNNVMKEIYSENYGESFEDIADAMATVTQNSDRINADSIKEMTEDAILLRDTFDFDVQESINAANMLMDQFGLSGNEAMTLVAQGVQQGLNKNGDLLDIINEYSVHFKQSGLDAENMFNMLANGAASGAFSIDTLGDAVKELGIKVKDGTADEAIIQLGLSADKTKQAFAEGGEAGQKAFQTVNDALFGIDDKVQQNIIGTQLYGTMWEDLGAEGVKALSDINGEFDRTADTLEEIKNIKYDDLGSALEGLKRTLSVDLLLPIGDQLTPAVNDIINSINTALSDGNLSAALSESASGLSGAISDAAINALPEIMDSLTKIMDTSADVITFLTDHWSTLQTIIIGLAGSFGTLNAVSGISNFVGAFKGTGKDLNNVVKSVQALSKISGFKGLLTGLQGVGKSITGVGTAIKGVGPVSKVLAGSIKGLGAAFTFLTSPVGLVIAGIAAAVAIGIVLYKNWDKIKETALNLWTGIQQAFEGIKNVVSEKFNSVKETVSNVMETAKGVVQEKLSNIKSAYEENGGGLKGIAAATMEGIKGYYTAGYDFINNLTGGKLGEVVETAKTKLSAMVGAVKDKITGVKDTFSSVFNSIKNTVSNIFDSIINKVKNVWNSIKSIIKTPSIKQTGTKSILGIDIPTFGIEWNAQGGIMTRPTIFGAVNNVLQGGGEAGPEAILPLAKFWDNLERYIYGAISTPVPAQTNTTNHINITVYGGNMDNESIAKEIAIKVKQALNNM